MKQTNTFKKILLVSSGIILAVFIILEIINIGVDIYNFRNITGIKKILSQYPKESYQFKNLAEFNLQYKTNIQPFKNCYYVSKSISSEKGYLLGFRYSSYFFSLFSFSKNYSFPRYNIPVRKFCFGDVCKDMNYENFNNIVSGLCINVE